MRRHYFTSWFVIVLGIWATGLIVFAQERQDLQGPQGQGGFFDPEQQTWVEITEEGQELMQQLRQQQASEGLSRYIFADPVGRQPPTVY